MYATDLDDGRHGGHGPDDGPVRVDQHQADVGSEFGQRRVRQPEMFSQHALAPRAVQQVKRTHGPECKHRVKKPFGERHILRKAVEDGWPVRGLVRLADHVSRPRQQVATTKQHEWHPVFGHEPE